MGILIVFVLIIALLAWFAIVGSSPQESKTPNTFQMLKEAFILDSLQDLKRRVNCLEQNNLSLRLKALEDHLKIEFVDSKTVNQYHSAHYVKKAKEKKQ